MSNIANQDNQNGVPLKKLFLEIFIYASCFALGFFACFLYFEDNYKEKVIGMRKEIEDNLDKEIFEILNSQISGLTTYSHKLQEQVNIDYLKYFVLKPGECHFYFENKNKHGDIKPHVKMAFYNKRGLCLGQTESIWLISSIYAGGSKLEIEDSTVYDIKDIAYYTVDIF